MTIDDNDNDNSTKNGIASPVRVGTVIWGFILMAIAAFFFAGTQFDLAGFNPAVVATWSVLGLGALAVIGGLAGALFRR